jgi:hypothetical protein
VTLTFRLGSLRHATAGSRRREPSESTDCELAGETRPCDRRTPIDRTQSRASAVSCWTVRECAASFRLFFASADQSLLPPSLDFFTLSAPCNRVKSPKMGCTWERTAESSAGSARRTGVAGTVETRSTTSARQVRSRRRGECPALDLLRRWEAAPSALAPRWSARAA